MSTQCVSDKSTTSSFINTIARQALEDAFKADDDDSDGDVDDSKFFNLNEDDGMSNPHC